MSALTLSQLTAQNLRDGLFKLELPEYYRLANFVENNPWHVQQDVFTHSVKVMEGLETILEFEFLAPAQRQLALAYCSTEVFKAVSRSDRLRAVVLLHDVAKSLVFTKLADGTTQTPGHEFMSAAVVSDYRERLAMSRELEKQVQDMVLLHGAISEVLNLELSHQKSGQFITLFERLAPDTTIDLIIFIYADMLGGNLAETMPTAFTDRISLLQTWVKERFA
jgi:hypothetical protein